MKRVSFYFRSSFWVETGSPSRECIFFFFFLRIPIYYIYPSSFSILFCRHTVIDVNERSHGQWLYYGSCVNVFFFFYIFIFNVTFLFLFQKNTFKRIKKFKKPLHWKCDDLAGKALTMVVGATENFVFQSFTYTSWYWETFNLHCQHREIATRTAL